jgi:hypothetical protein
MNLQGYRVLHDDRHECYFFLSSGKRGIIKKFIIYQTLATNQYNLAFGDWDEKKLMLDNSARSNNGDRNKVIATVALTIADFLKFHPFSEVLIKGSTPARTRFYQMGLNKYWSEIENQFMVKGNTKGNWENFKKGVAYEAFAIKAKKR